MGLATGRAPLQAVVTLVTLSILCVSLAANAQQPTKVYRIGRLAPGPPEGNPFTEVFRQALHDLGYIESQNLVIEYRWAEGHQERLPDLAAELVRLKETVPQSTRVAVLANPDSAPSLSAMTTGDLTVAAQALGLQLQVVELRRAEELDDAFAAMTRAGADALYVLGEPLLLDGLRGRIAELAAQHQLPAMYTWRMYVDVGGLMSYGVSLLERYRRAAVFVDKILKGSKPVDLPVELPHKLELFLNLKTAEALGITLPPSLLRLADEVIK